MGSGEIPALTDDEWEDVDESMQDIKSHGSLNSSHQSQHGSIQNSPQRTPTSAINRKRGSHICQIYTVGENLYKH